MIIHKEGYASICFVLTVSLLLSITLLLISDFALYSYIISFILVGFAIFVISFFRVPVREKKGSATLVSAPADGKVIIIKEVEEPEYFKGRVLQVSIFMSVFNVHANWYPITGKVCYFKYHPGDYLIAKHPKASIHNERSSIAIRNEHGCEVLCRQIAGLIARRIVCYTKPNTEVKAGEELGFIKFGSRADLFFPLGTKINVKLGDRVVGSETIIAEINK